MKRRSWRASRETIHGLAKRLWISLVSIACAAAAAPAPASAAEPLATCFWEGPISMKRPTSRGFDGRGFNFPEESATYWLARFRLPAGARLRLRGRYSRSRYQSINAYSAGEPTDALADVQTAPNAGSVNPFVAGNRRDSSRRDYTVDGARRGAAVPAGAEHALRAQQQRRRHRALLPGL